MRLYKTSVWAPALMLGGLLIADPGHYQARSENPEESTRSAQASPALASGGLPAFGTITLAPAFELDGAGSNVDSIAFWEAPDSTNTLLLVTAKANDLVEVWKHPFKGHELPSRQFPNNINGIAVDQVANLLYVSDRKVSVLSLPDLQLVDEFGQGIIGVGENNLAIFKQASGQTIIYVSEDHKVHRFAAGTWDHLGSFAPPVTSIETVLADNFYQLILVPEEQGSAGSPGVYAYHPDGAPFLRNGTNRFGNNGEFDSDEEGILLYTFPTNGKGDNGAGFYMVTDQKSDQTDFEFFDRQTWAHLGTLRIEGVSNTDGIASTQLAMPGYPLGLFAAINNDTTTVGLGWDVILKAMGMTTYRLWALDNGLALGVNDGFLDDPDGDGSANISEFAIDGAPLTGTRNGKQRVGIEDVDGMNYLTYTCPVHNGAAFIGNGELSAAVDGIVYALAGTFDLIDFGRDVVERIPALDAGLPAPNPGWSYRTFRLNRALSDQTSGFIRLRIQQAP